MGNIILTGDRPTGKLHLGHYVGSLRNRLKIQEEGDYEKLYIMIADAQALTDNFSNVEKIRENILEVALDYLAIGLDPNKSNIFIQSLVPELTEFTFYYMNLVTLSRLKRNPTVKSEMNLKGYSGNIPVGFLCYPISQTADITAFNANLVPVGIDQLPMIEQARDIVRTFNNTYKTDILIEPEAMLPKTELEKRLPGIDGKEKMSKSLGNAIYLSDEDDVIKKKVMSMYTDPNHLKISDPGEVEGNMVFAYLDIFCKDDHFIKFLPEYNNLDELKNHYRKGGLGDVKIKLFLNSILQELISPIRERRKKLSENPEEIFKILISGSLDARKVAANNLAKLKEKMGIDYKELLEQ